MATARIIFRTPTTLDVFEPSDVKRIAVVRDGTRSRWRLEALLADGRTCASDWSRLSDQVDAITTLFDLLTQALTCATFATSSGALDSSDSEPQTGHMLPASSAESDESPLTELEPSEVTP